MSSSTISDAGRSLLIGISVGAILSAVVLTIFYQHKLERTLSLSHEQWLHRGVIVDYRGLKECLPSGFECDESSLTIAADAAHTAKPAPPRTSSPKTAPIPIVMGPDGQPWSCENEIITALRLWSAALDLGQLNQHVAYYADQMNPYFLASSPVPKRVIRNDKSHLLSSNTLAAFGIDQIRFEAPPCTTTAVFRKTWETRYQNHLIRHEVWDRVHLKRHAEGWRITGEEDLTTRVKHAKARR